MLAWRREGINHYVRGPSIAYLWSTDRLCSSRVEGRGSQGKPWSINQSTVQERRPSDFPNCSPPWMRQRARLQRCGHVCLTDRGESREHDLTNLPSVTFSNGLPKDLFVQFARQVGFWWTCIMGYGKTMPFSHLRWNGIQSTMLHLVCHLSGISFNREGGRLTIP